MNARAEQTAEGVRKLTRTFAERSNGMPADRKRGITYSAAARAPQRTRAEGGKIPKSFGIAAKLIRLKIPAASTRDVSPLFRTNLVPLIFKLLLLEATRSKINLPVNTQKPTALPSINYLFLLFKHLFCTATTKQSNKTSCNVYRAFVSISQMKNYFCSKTVSNRTGSQTEDDFATDEEY